MSPSTNRFIITAWKGAFGALIVYAVVQLVQLYEHHLASLDQQIAVVAKGINRQLPMRIDQSTELIAVQGLAGTLQYNYRFVDISASDADTVALLDRLRPKVKNQACSAPELRTTLIDRGITVRFAYVDKDLHRLFSIDVRSADCAAVGGA